MRDRLAKESWLLDLRNVRKLITHDNCMDGLSTAMIVRDVLPELPVEFVQYGTPEYEGLQPEQGLLFCDMSPPRARVSEFVAAGALVLDHHKHARDVVAAFGACGVFADEELEPGVSGAVLAFREVWQPLAAAGYHWSENPNEDAMAEFAMLAGVRDCWRKDSPRWTDALHMYDVLSLYPREHWLPEGAHVHEERIVELLDDDMHVIGPVLRAARGRAVASMAGDVFVDATDSRRAWALGMVPVAYVSDLAEHLRAERAVNVFVNVTPQLQRGVLKTSVSLRSDGSLDVGGLAKARGGGGHSKAAGFGTQESDPFVVFDTLRR